MNETLETGYVAEYLTPGMPVELDTASITDEWFKIGVSVQNDSDKEPITVSVKVEGVEVRIADKDVSEASDEIIIHNGKEYKKSELCRATLHWLDLSEEERMLSSY